MLTIRPDRAIEITSLKDSSNRKYALIKIMDRESRDGVQLMIPAGQFMEVAEIFQSFAKELEDEA